MNSEIPDSPKRFSFNNALCSHRPSWCHMALQGAKTPLGQPEFLKHWVGKSLYYEQVYAGEMGEKEKRNGSCAVVRESSEAARAVRNGLMFAACLPAGTKVMSGLGCCLELCLVLWPYHSWGPCWHPWLTLPSRPQGCVVSWGPCCCWGHVDLSGLCCHQGTWWHWVWAAARNHA